MLSDSSQIIFFKVIQVQCQSVFVIAAVIVFLSFFMCVSSSFSFYVFVFVRVSVYENVQHNATRYTRCTIH